MASSSSAPGSSSNKQQQETPAYEIKGRTMSLEEWDLKIQTECPVDFVSLAAHNCDIGKFYDVRASIYDREAAKIEEDEKVLLNPGLKGKSREEMGLEPFLKTEIRSSIMGIPVNISEDVIAFVLRRPATGEYKVGITKVKNSPWNEVVNQTLYNKEAKGTYADMTSQTKLMLKIQNENLLPKGGGSDQPSLEHKILLHFFITGVYANVPRYIFRHMVQQLIESQMRNRCWVPYGRLLSEIFHQGGLLNLLKDVDFFTDEQLGTVTGKIINGETLKSMHLIKKEDYKQLSTDMSVSDSKSALMTDFPPICKQDPLDVQMHYIREHFERTKRSSSCAKSRKTKSKALSKEDYLVEEEAPRKPSKRSKTTNKDGVAAPKPKRTKTVKTESSTVSASEEVIQKKRNKEPEVQDAAREAALQAIRSRRAKEERSVQERIKEAAEQLRREEEKPSLKKANELAKRKHMAELYKKKRDEQLKAAGYNLDAEKAAVIASLAAELEEQTVKEGTALLKEALKAKNVSEAKPSEPASKATRSEAYPSGISSDPKAQFNVQTFNLPSSPSSSSSSTDSDEISLSQHIKQCLPNFKPSKTIPSDIPDYDQMQINFSQQRIKICEKLPADHFFQPPIIEPLNIQHPETNLAPQKASEVASEAATSEDPQQHQTSTLHNLEKHLGGEMPPIPTKASKTVPEKTVLENQQSNPQPETSTSQEQNVPKQTVPKQIASDLPQTNPEQQT
ncbi:hypothetical protein MtrunA17_Chr6g0471791 [Medicago truncatula]|uniref:Uncharacterized protein n=1 Tax=Medicago truncatula TaxID=3880 RepID=A0A396HKC0_MEDTR|nr:hypothetical protein MtrunA17_Chr6g0471791 [Medicago truncatula]